MKTKLFLLLVLFLATGITSTAFQEKQDHKVLFEKAKYTMETKADLKEAINLFESLITTFPNEKEYVAKSLLYQGMCYEKLGNQMAVKKYQRLVKNYPGQKQEVALAKERLSILIQVADKVKETKDLLIRKVLENTSTILTLNMFITEITITSKIEIKVFPASLTGMM